MIKTRTTDPAKAKAVTTTYTYDACGNPTNVTISASGLSNRFINYTYDNKFRFPETIENSLAHTITKTYDFRFGAITSETDANNFIGVKIDRKRKVAATTLLRASVSNSSQAPLLGIILAPKRFLPLDVWLLKKAPGERISWAIATLSIPLTNLINSLLVKCTAQYPFEASTEPRNFKILILILASSMFGNKIIKIRIDIVTVFLLTYNLPFGISQLNELAPALHNYICILITNHIIC